MYFPDLSPYAYIGVEPLTLMVDWLDAEHPFPIAEPSSQLRGSQIPSTGGVRGSRHRMILEGQAMMRLRRVSVVVTLLLLISVSAHAEGAWVLWSKVYIMKDGKIADHFYPAEAFTSKPECENAARRYTENYQDEGARKADFKCFPETVDPREPKTK